MRSLLKAKSIAALLFLTLFSHATYVAAQDIDSVESSPKQGWIDGSPVPPASTQDRPSTLRQVLLWFPNRILDFIDVFRVDLGVGLAAGAVVRVTEYGQAGYRQMLPLSVRVGDFGREVPIMFEHGNEIGIGPAFLPSSQRPVCPGEVGIGADLVVGAYVGVCFDELADFALGIFTVDFKSDDLE